MDAKVEQHVIIKFFSNEGTTAVEIASKLLRAFQEDACLLPIVYEWT
jgi:adenosylmethionine-8-amino-7-oxononanoate aminotransferase